MISIRVVLIEPLYEGNVGSVCRSMKNFGFADIVLVKPCRLDNFAKAMASHAQDLLATARIVDTFDEALEGADLLVATTGKPGAHINSHVRYPFYNPKELRTMLEDKSGTAALIFGREDAGLPNEIVERCDIVAYIPTSKDYPIMNLAQAVSIFLYELSGFKGGNVALADREDVDRLYENYSNLLDDINYPEHKKDKTMMMLRRIYGRAMLNRREYYTMMGVLHEIGLALERAKKR
ncbi:putative RNA methyltransferase [Methanocella paludicola SANAE]|uniref:RNA methyltransferase n=1 Tax=Methanocella paludicola (strain DSM 17711 / JCM 13418 / NBRC 101707 / SANAE) TaxID=304371 RepID=D1YWI0_METPS|nr:RNA methyltransferase [Methanocella paludicola]BAI60802.1 putative RNA methyltransferase [Methanocella paludicola SANAE]